MPVVAAGEPILRSVDGWSVPLLVDRWTAAPAEDELDVLDRAVAPVLDVGCGPGRHVGALAGRGVVALGIDVAASAVASARRRGSSVLQRSVFDRLPNEGRYGTALLIDGNIGIGGDPVALLIRLRTLLRPGGLVLVEVEPPGFVTDVATVRVERAAEAGPWFRWARVGLDDVDAIAAAAGLRRTWTSAGRPRWFVEMRS